MAYFDVNIISNNVKLAKNLPKQPTQKNFQIKKKIWYPRLKGSLLANFVDAGLATDCLEEEVTNGGSFFLTNLLTHGLGGYLGHNLAVVGEGLTTN